MGESVTPTDDNSAKQVERLRQHLIELDQEMEAESIRHERERTLMMAKIKELEEALVAKDSGGEIDEGQNEELKKQVIGYQLQLDNMKLSVEMLESRIEEEVREKTANLTLELQKKQTEIEQLSKQLEASSYELSTVVAEKEIQKKLEKDAEANARLIDDLNSEVNELRQRLERETDRNSKDPNGLVEKKVVAGLIVSYLSCTDKVRRVELLSLIADMLCLDTEQRLLVGVQQHSTLEEYTQPRLAELWTAFLIGRSA